MYVKNAGNPSAFRMQGQSTNRLVRLTGAYSISRNCLVSSMLAVNERSQRLEGGGRDVLDVVYRSYTRVWAVFEWDSPEVGAGRVVRWR